MTSDPAPSVTDELLAHLDGYGLHPREGPSGVAERLVLLAHRAVDFQTSFWADRRPRYWDGLADRVRAGTYRARSLWDWWQWCTRHLGADPMGAGPRDRVELEQLLAGDPDRDRAVLEELRRHAEAYVLRCRLIAEARRAASSDRPAPGP
jgi:hypothetical protein